jgi:hypothetical protein
MTDIPIIFSAPMVLALLDGRKTMTRRLAWQERKITKPIIGQHSGKRVGTSYHGTKIVRSPWQDVKQGDRLWVRENWKPHSIYAAGKPRDVPSGTKIWYAADEGYSPSNTPWKPSIYLPRWASRLTLGVTATKVEPLLDISGADAKAEGFEAGQLNDGFGPRQIGGGWTVESPGTFCSAGGMFQLTWTKLHPDWDGYSSPEVVALTFTVHKQNIDTLPKAAAA